MRRIALIAIMALVAVACGGTDDSDSRPNAQAAEAGTRPAIVPMGDPVAVGGWDVRVVGSQLDRGETGSNLAVVAVQLSAWFSGNDTSTLDDGLELAAVALSGRRYAPNFAKCDDGLEVYRSLQPDQSIQGFVCFFVESADAADLLLELTARDSSGEPVLMETISGTNGGDDFGPDELVEALIDSGVHAILVDSPYERSGMIPGATKEWVLCLDGQDSQLYEYATDQLREAVSATIQPNGNPENGFIDLYYGRLMWWAKGRVLVNYNFDDPTLSGNLTTALGETISPQATRFTDPPDPLPASDLCSFGD